MSHLEILADQSDLRSERTHAFNLQRIGVNAGKNSKPQPTLASSKGQALAKIARRRTHQMRSSFQSCGEIFRAATFERTNGIQRFDLDDNAAAQLLLQCLCPELR